MEQRHACHHVSAARRTRKKDRVCGLATCLKVTTVSVCERGGDGAGEGKRGNSCCGVYNKSSVCTGDKGNVIFYTLNRRHCALNAESMTLRDVNLRAHTQKTGFTVTSASPLLSHWFSPLGAVCISKDSSDINRFPTHFHTILFAALASVCLRPLHQSAVSSDWSQSLCF